MTVIYIYIAGWISTYFLYAAIVRLSTLDPEMEQIKKPRYGTIFITGVLIWWITAPILVGVYIVAARASREKWGKVPRNYKPQEGDNNE